MASQLTYLLGAGASFQSIPIVKTFTNRLLKFQIYLLDKSNAVRGEDRRKFVTAANGIHALANEFSAHQSFDTYFKKLFHFGKYDIINSGKRLLNLYFLWEHSNSSLNYNDRLTENDFKKQSLFDRRYDALIAGLLHPITEKSDPICEINFLSWNYDINLINSIKNFFYPNITYGEFINNVRRDQFLWEIDNRIRIININGYFYSSLIDKSLSILDSNPEQIIDKNISEGYHSKSEIDEDADKIKFAWELNAQDEKTLKLCLQNIMSQTLNLVIVGYTFPLYNRFIDFGYLHQEDFLKKNVIVQDPNAESLRKNLIDIFRISNEKVNIEPITNCDSFYVPSSVFGIENYKPDFPVLV